MAASFDYVEDDVPAVAVGVSDRSDVFRHLLAVGAGDAAVGPGPLGDGLGRVFEGDVLVGRAVEGDDGQARAFAAIEDDAGDGGHGGEDVRLATAREGGHFGAVRHAGGEHAVRVDAEGELRFGDEEDGEVDIVEAVIVIDAGDVPAARVAVAFGGHEDEALAIGDGIEPRVGLLGERALAGAVEAEHQRRWIERVVEVGDVEAVGALLALHGERLDEVPVDEGRAASFAAGALNRGGDGVHGRRADVTEAVLLFGGNRDAGRRTNGARPLADEDRGRRTTARLPRTFECGGHGDEGEGEQPGDKDPAHRSSIW